MLHQIRTFTHVAWVIISCFTLLPIAQQASFQIIPTPGSFETNVQAQAVAAEGKIAIGGSFLFDQDPSTCTVFRGCPRTFRLSTATGPQDIGVIVDKSQALGISISADGLKIVGQAYNLNSFQSAFIWTSSIGIRIWEHRSSRTTGRIVRVRHTEFRPTEERFAGRAIPTQSSVIPRSGNIFGPTESIFQGFSGASAHDR